MKKKLYLLFITLLVILPLSAMSGFSPYIIDESGEFVFYKDSSFTRESYIGLLCYDEATFQIKYYAPKNQEKSLGEKEIALLVTVNTDEPYMELTGEKIISQILPDTEDVDIVNYLHDILYEFSAHRILADEELILSLESKNFLKNPEKTLIQNYEQFGGNVAITYNALIPFFNIKEIKAADGSSVLSCVTFGQISSTEDKTFDNFKGIPASEEKIQKGNLKASKPKKITYKNKTLTLDSNWENVLNTITQSYFENLFTLGNYATLSLSELALPNEDFTKEFLYVTKKILQSSQDSIVDFSASYIKWDSKVSRCQIYIELYAQDSKRKKTNNTILIKNSEDSLSYLSLAVFKEIFDSNLAYFNKILKSY